ncbi:MAG: Rrf2 family transcriptional regulator [Pseudanabaenaceae cyanobacterium bins.68]|nr:Rrf2 family transcriptional regulator [Pseudanabaenaceae cyanobacterium bins.68]
MNFKVELSLKTEYSILALIELASNHASDQPVQIRQIASQQQIPDRYLEQLLATLRRHGFVKSQRGARGGYILSRQPNQISILEVVTCVEGVESADQSSTSAQPSVVKELWQASQKAAASVLSQATIKDLCDRQREQRLAETMYYI